MTKRKFVDGHPFVSYVRKGLDGGAMLAQVTGFYQMMEERRTVRDFSPKPVAKEVIAQVLRTASTAPSGAHKQPWTFCVVSNPEVKKQIREAAEREEYESYHGRLPAEWLEDLSPLQTSWQKPFLETAPYLIVVFKKSYEWKNGRKRNTYYAVESCGIAVGFLLAAIHQAGLVALTHTPSPMNFLATLLNRPENEKPFLLIPVGYAAEECWVPDLKRKTPEEITVWYE